MQRIMLVIVQVRVYLQVSMRVYMHDLVGAVAVVLTGGTSRQDGVQQLRGRHQLLHARKWY